MSVRGAPLLWLLAALLLTVAVYWPGLNGGYLFDDYPNIVDNTDLHVQGDDFVSWRRAALSSPSKDLRRPLAMLSFAANYAGSGLAPRPMKLTNLAIHLFNGALLYALLLCLLDLWNARRPQPQSRQALQWMALGLAGAWMVSPVNLSSVLYVVQRMESLGQSFVLAGLWLYLSGRRRMLQGRGGSGMAAAGLLLGASLGLLCKESAVLLPVYALLVEWALLRFEAAEARDRWRLQATFVLLLLLPAVAGLAWLLPRVLVEGAYATRSFTLDQRLLTELRVLVDYCRWILLPLPGTLSFYHDDIAVSTGWWSPPATLGAALLLGAMFAAAVAARPRLPTFSLGIGWFFAAHLLTATVIPLELSFEHRNYFASIGLLLAVASLLICIPDRYQMLRWAVSGLAVASFAGSTALRASEWSNPVRLAYAEADTHPDSPRANYELGKTLTILSGYREDSRLIDPALEAFERAAALPGSGTLPCASMILVASRGHRQIKPQWWDSLVQRLTRHSPSSEDISALHSLARCQHDGGCPAGDSRLLNAFLAALDHPGPPPELLATYGAFAANQLGDYPVAVAALRDAVNSSPGNVGFRLDLLQTLILENDRTQALAQLEILRHQDSDPGQSDQIERLAAMLLPLPAASPAAK